MSTVTPIRPGLQWAPNVAYVHTLPPGITLLDLRDCREDGRGMMLNFDVAGTADALVAAGFVTHELLASIPKSGKKTIREETPINQLSYLYRRKHDYRVDICLYGDDNPDLPRYVAMFGLDRKVQSVASARLTSGGRKIAEMYEALPATARAQVEGLISAMLKVYRP